MALQCNLAIFLFLAKRDRNSATLRPTCRNPFGPVSKGRTRVCVQRHVSVHLVAGNESLRSTLSGKERQKSGSLHRDKSIPAATTASRCLFRIMKQIQDKCAAMISYHPNKGNDTWERNRTTVVLHLKQVFISHWKSSCTSYFLHFPALPHSCENMAQDIKMNVTGVKISSRFSESEKTFGSGVRST